MSLAYNSEWWFLKEYLFALLAGAIFISVFKKCDKFYLEMFAVIIIQISAALIFPKIREILDVQDWNPNLWLANMFCMNEATPLFFVGVVFSKYGVFEQLKQNMDKFKNWWIIAVSLTGIILCAYSRAFIVHGGLDLVLIPVYIFFMWTFVNQIPLLGKCLRIIGNHSTSMWLIHSFFIYYFGVFAKIIYGFGNWLIAFLAFFGIAFITSVVLDTF